MRIAIGVLATVSVLAGCSGGKSGADAGLLPGVVIGTDRTALGFGEEFGDANLLGTKPAETLQIFDLGQQDLTLSSVSVVNGTDFDGGELTDSADFSITGPSATTVQGGDAALVQIVFDSTIANHQGYFGAVLEIKSNAANHPTLDIPMTVDIVTPEVSVLNNGGSTNVTLPQVTLAQLTDDQGNPVTFSDGGAEYGIATASSDIWLANTGTAQLQFQPAYDAVDGGSEDVFPCANLDQQLISQCVQTGPLPDSLDRIYPDGGLAVQALDGGDYLGAAKLSLVFHPAAPGTYVQHVLVDSNATNTPELVFTVTGTAVAP